MRIQTTHLIVALGMLMFASCSTEQEVFTAEETINERIDIVLESTEKEYIYLQNQGNSNEADLVDVTLYGVPSARIDIHINLDDSRTLVFQLTDEVNWNPWEQEGGFSMYATRELDDKQKFVTVELLNGSEVPSHTSNMGNAFPQGTYVNVFQILDFNPANNEIFCRINDLPMINTTDGGIMTVTGTFRGTISIAN